MFIVADVYFSSKLFTAVRQAASIENVRQSLFQGTAIATKGAPVIQPALPVHTVKPHTTEVACFQGFSPRTAFLPYSQSSAPTMLDRQCRTQAN